MADRYDEAVEALRRVPAPDQWDEIERRAHRPADEAWGGSPAGDHGRQPRWPLMAAAAAVLLLAVVGTVLVLADRNGSNVETDSSRRTGQGPTSTNPPDITASAPSTTTTEEDAAGSEAPADYAAAVWSGWLDGDEDELRGRAQPPVAEFLLARASDDADPDADRQCEGAAGSTFCSWTLTSGTELQLRVDNAAASAGEDQAVVEAAFVPTPDSLAIWPSGAGAGPFTQEEAQNQQAEVDQGSSPWLLEEEAVIGFYGSSVLGWSEDIAEVAPAGDDLSAFTLTNPTTGVVVDVTLTQPVRQGEGGIWVMTRASVSGPAVADPADDAGSPPEATCADLQLASVNAPEDMDRAQQEAPADDPRLPEAAWPPVIGVFNSSSPERAVFVVTGYAFAEEGGFDVEDAFYVEGPGDQQSWVVHDGDKGLAELTIQLNRVDCDLTLFSFGLSREELVQFVQGVGHAD